MDVTNDLKIITTIQKACVREKKVDLGKCYELEIILIKLDFAKDIFRRKSMVDLPIRLDIVGARETKRRDKSERREKNTRKREHTFWALNIYLIESILA